MLVNIFIGCLLVTNESVQALIDSGLQLLLVIHELHDFVASVFEILNLRIVVA